MMGSIFCDAYDKDYRILEFILGAPYFGTTTYIYIYKSQ